METVDREKRGGSILTCFDAVVNGLVVSFSIFPELLSEESSLPVIRVVLHRGSVGVHQQWRCDGEDLS